MAIIEQGIESHQGEGGAELSIDFRIAQVEVRGVLEDDVFIAAIPPIGTELEGKLKRDIGGPDIKVIEEDGSGYTKIGYDPYWSRFALSAEREILSQSQLKDRVVSRLREEGHKPEILKQVVRYNDLDDSVEGESIHAAIVAKAATMQVAE